MAYYQNDMSKYYHKKDANEILTDFMHIRKTRNMPLQLHTINALTNCYNSISSTQPNQYSTYTQKKSIKKTLTTLPKQPQSSITDKINNHSKNLRGAKLYERIDNLHLKMNKNLDILNVKFKDINNYCLTDIRKFKTIYATNNKTQKVLAKDLDSNKGNWSLNKIDKVNQYKGRLNTIA